MNRRQLMLASALFASGSSLARSGDRTASSEQTFLLVHGAWHASIHWNKVVVELAALGHRVMALDLPGSGLDARYPTSYLTRDQMGFETETSKVGNLGLHAYVEAVLSVLRSLSAAHGRITLVGHSFGGMTITLAAEREPQLIRRLVYVTAFCPATLPGGSINDYSALPENSRSLAGSILLGDPKQINAFRINPRSTDAAYLERARLAFYGDVAPGDFLPYAMHLTPDLPLPFERRTQ